MLQAVILISNLDYSAVAETVISHFSENMKLSMMFSILDKPGDKSDEIIYATREVLSQNEKDDIVSCIISTYEQEIISQVNSFAIEKGLSISIGGFEIRNYEDEGVKQ